MTQKNKSSDRTTGNGGPSWNRILLIIPACNEEIALPELISRVKSDYPDLDVLVVDDGSSDSTRHVAEKAGVRVVSHIARMGYGVALQTGYKYAWKRPEYMFIVQMDGDGQHRAEDIEQLIAPLVRGEADLVIGSRFLTTEESYPVPALRKLGIGIFRFLLYLGARRRILDITSGFQAFSRKVLSSYVTDEFPYYFPDADVLLLQLRTGLKIVEVPALMCPNREGRSMHKGLGRQLFYVCSMVLSITVAVLRTWVKQRFLRSRRKDRNDCRGSIRQKLSSNQKSGDKNAC